MTIGPAGPRFEGAMIGWPALTARGPSQPPALLRPVRFAKAHATTSTVTRTLSVERANGTLKITRRLE